MPRALNSRLCRHNNSMRKSESPLEESNLSNRCPRKSKLSKPSFSNLSKPFPLDLTISNETMMVAMAKEDEEVPKATFATTVVETITMTIVAKAKTQVGDDILMTRISPASYMAGDTVQTSVLYSGGKLANSSHLEEIRNETCTA